MFPGGNSNTDLGYNKHNQYMAQPPHFLVAPGGPGTVPGPNHGPVIGNALRSAAPGMPVTMPQGPIDWAQLAQQWIHMRDSATAPAPAPPLANFSLNMPIAPPPPIISNAPEYHHSEIRQHAPKKQTHYEEHGEAEMDMDLEDEENENNCRAVQGLSSDSLPRVPVVAQSPWLDTGIPDVSVAVANNDAVGSSQQQWNSWPTRANPTAHIPSLLKLNVCNPNEPQQIPQTQQLQANNGSTTSEIDANKRKMLPAWIREGLEKMEREKQRQLERQQAPTSPESESPATSGNVKQVSSKSLTTPVNLLNITNVPSDSEDSSNAGPDEEAPYASSVPQLLGNDDDATDDVLGKASGSEEEDEDQKPVNDDDPKLKSQRQPKDTIGRDNVDNVARSANAAEAALSGKNYEERLADLMLVVRRTLTEILLETTNEEIAAIASETLKAHRAKASSAQVIRKSALSSITGNLGLAAYGDSSSESGEEDNSDDGGQVEHSLDSAAKEAREKSDELSAEDLKARIRKSKRAFERVIDDIEERVLLQEKLDEKKLQYHRKLEQERLDAARQPNAKADASTSEDATTAAQSTATDKLQQFSSKRLSRKERTTRFSDNKDGKQPCQSYVSQVVAAAAVQSSIMPQKLKPVPNPATNLLQMPESMASMLSAADKALNKAHSKTTKKSKSRRRQSSSSSSSSSSVSGSSSSSSSDSNSSSNSSKSTSNTDGSSTRSSHAAKKHGSSRSHRPSNRSSSSRARSESSRKAHRKSHHTSSTSSSRRDSNRHRSSRGSRERDRDRRGSHYSSSQHSRDRRRHRDSSDSGDDSASGDHKRSSRHSSSRSHQSSSYNKHRGRTRSRSRSKSRSTHNSYASSSASTTKHQNRKRH